MITAPENARTTADSTEGRSPRTFALRFFLFLLPLLLLAAWVEITLWRLGETIPVTKVLAVQRESPNTVWMRGELGQAFPAYKWAGLNRQKHDVLAVGSSRVMQFRREMLAPESGSFYNTGGMVRSVEDLNAFAASLPDDLQPRVVLLGIDIWWLNPSWPSTDKFTVESSQDPAHQWAAHLTVARKLRRHLRNIRKSKKQQADDSRSSIRYLGIEAILTGRGFRADGSLDSGLTYSGNTFSGNTFKDREQPPIAERVRSGGTQFEFSSGLSTTRTDLLRNALRTLRRRGIIVCTFLPPLASEAARAMEKTPGQQKLWRQYTEELPRICAEEGTHFVDASSPGRLGHTDAVMMDGIHALETFHLSVLDNWLHHRDVASALPGTRQRVRKMLDSPRTNPWFPDYDVTSAAGRSVGDAGERLR